MLSVFIGESIQAMVFAEHDVIKSAFIAFTATLFCIWLLKPIALHIGLVDRPGGRKSHENDVPLIGGIAMFFGFCFALLTLHFSLQPYRGLLAGGGLLLMMGVVDDFKELSSKLRLFGQVLATVILISWGGHMITNLGNILFVGDVHLYQWAFPITTFVVVGYLNAMNMIDGQDGLAGGVALGQVILLGALSVQLQRYSDTLMLMILAVILLVFLGFNLRLPWRKSASIFMGDAGSTVIAFLIAWFAIDVSQAHIHVVRPISILWVLAFPLFDLISVMLHRFLNGKPVLSASRDHFHHVLHVYNINSSLSTLLLCVLSFSLGLIGLLMNAYNVPDGMQFLGLLTALFFYLLLVRIVRR